MRVLILLCSLAMFFWGAPAVFADIYVWTDANGVKNFTNNAPPEQAVVFMETPEIDEIELNAPVSDTIAHTDSDDAEPLHAEELRAAQEKIETLSEQVAGLQRELREAFEPVPEPPPVDSTDVYESTQPIRYRTVYGYGSYALYDPYGYRWYHKAKRHFRRPGYRHGGHKKALPYKRRFTHHGLKKRLERHGVRSDRHRPGYRQSHRMMRRTQSGASRRHSGQRPGYRGGLRSRR
jgi:hypothetical protein